MAASAKPAAGGHRSSANTVNSNGNGVEKANGGSASATGYSAVEPIPRGLGHNPGISVGWTEEEQSMLKELLAKYASEKDVIRYAIIAPSLRDKTVRDVAFRCRWISKRETVKRKKEDNSSPRKNKNKKEKVLDPLPKSSQVANRTNGPAYAQSISSLDSDDGITFNTIGGEAGQLLEHSARALDQIFANFSALKLHENMNLFREAQANIMSILNDSSVVPKMVKPMPPLPVKLNVERANSIFSQAHLTVKPNEELFVELANSFLPQTPLPVKLNEELANSILPQTPISAKINEVLANPFLPQTPISVKINEVLANPFLPRTPLT